MRYFWRIAASLVAYRVVTWTLGHPWSWTTVIVSSLVFLAVCEWRDMRPGRRHFDVKVIEVPIPVVSAGEVRLLFLGGVDRVFRQDLRYRLAEAVLDDMPSHVTIAVHHDTVELRDQFNQVILTGPNPPYYAGPRMFPTIEIHQVMQ